MLARYTQRRLHTRLLKVQVLGCYKATLNVGLTKWQVRLGLLCHAFKCDDSFNDVVAALVQNGRALAAQPLLWVCTYTCKSHALQQAVRQAATSNASSYNDVAQMMCDTT